jgi:predicted O-methyltransferase YrrM
MKATWCPNDSKFYQSCTHAVSGQINDTGAGSLGTFLKGLASTPMYTSYLEIGTWNGLGSTRCFYQGFAARAADAPTPRLLTLECNADKCTQAQEVYHDAPHN